MTNPAAELLLRSVYGDSIKQLTDLVMAAEEAFDQFGKVTLFGKNKSKEAEQRFHTAIALCVLALTRAGRIRDPHDAEESFAAVTNAMSLVREAYPNWPRAYKYWDGFLVNLEQPNSVARVEPLPMRVSKPVDEATPSTVKAVERRPKWKCMLCMTTDVSINDMGTPMCNHCRRSSTVVNN